jgi:hypothetical protein
LVNDENDSLSEQLKLLSFVSGWGQNQDQNFKGLKMNIASIDYSPSTESLDIYVSGCNKPHCNGCHNPDL